MEKVINKKTKSIILTLIILAISGMHGTIYAVDVNKVINVNTNPPVDVSPIMGKALGIAMTIGAVIAAVMMVIIAIKYMTSAPNEKAEIKKYLIPYVVGAVLVFASSGIVGLVISFVEDSINK